MSVMVQCRVDLSNLMAAQKILQQHSRYDAPQVLNRTAYFVIRAAKDLTPAVTVPRIDAELGVISTPPLYKRGPNKGQPRPAGKFKAFDLSIVEGGEATKIILARMHRGSRYNNLTDHRYYIPRESFSPGEGVKGFWKKVEAAAKRMVKARHSSIGFFRITWNAILHKLRPHLPPGYSVANPGKQVNPELGYVSPAVVNRTRFQCTVENAVGNDPKYPMINARRNAAAQRILYPVLQRAVDQNFESLVRRFISKRWMDHKQALSRFGVMIDV